MSKLNILAKKRTQIIVLDDSIADYAEDKMLSVMLLINFEFKCKQFDTFLILSQDWLRLYAYHINIFTKQMLFIIIYIWILKLTLLK